jgi:hypothetical protein
LTNLGELERIAKKYAELKKSGNDSEVALLASSIVDFFSLPTFSFPLKEETLSNDGTTTYVYVNNATFPALYDFLGELLHSTVPLVVRDAKFGPGEIIINNENKEQADAELGLCVRELQEIVHAKKSQIFDRYADAA